MIVGDCIMAVGGGLLTTLGVTATSAEWIGYQVLNGVGMGTMFQTPNLAAQTVVRQYVYSVHWLNQCIRVLFVFSLSICP